MPIKRAKRTRAKRPHLLEGLGLVGLDDIEPVVVAAAAAELPMLLVGPHGTGKSLLLTRVAEALGLTWRHYNASLLIGPEGGLSAMEIQRARTSGFSAVRLGPRILRTETAGVAVIAATQALWGDFASHDQKNKAPAWQP